MLETLPNTLKPKHVSPKLVGPSAGENTTETAQELPKEVSTWPQGSPDANMTESEKL